MSGKMKKQLNKYFRKIYWRIPANRRTKKSIISQFEKSVSSYVADHPDCTFEDIAKEFGAIDDIVKSFFDDMSTEQIIHSVKRKKFIITIVVLCSLIVCGLLCYKIYGYNQHQAINIDNTTYIQGN